MDLPDRWIGRETIEHDRLAAGLLDRFCATLDRRADPTAPVPQGLHWCLAPPSAPTAALGSDGHLRRDSGDAGLLPPIPLPRRMWAAGQLRFVQPLHVGEPIERHSTVASVTAKTGGSGTLVFVELLHRLSGPGGLAIEERQTIVYRPAPPPGAEPVPPPIGAARFRPAAGQHHRCIVPTPPLLFRYSALTFNSHRIHYDLPYAHEEGYRGLVVHGPLTATLLLDLARAVLGDQPLADFAFRAQSPALAGEPLHLTLAVNGDACTLSALADDGRIVMTASGTRATG